MSPFSLSRPLVTGIRSISLHLPSYLEITTLTAQGNQSPEKFKPIQMSRSPRFLFNWLGAELRQWEVTNKTDQKTLPVI